MTTKPKINLNNLSDYHLTDTGYREVIACLRKMLYDIDVNRLSHRNVPVPKVRDKPVDHQTDLDQIQNCDCPIQLDISQEDRDNTLVQMQE